VRPLTFDRYLIASFLHVFAACFVAMFGLMVVVDLLENLDEFLARAEDRGTVVLLWNIVRYYGFQSVFFFDRAGAALLLLSVICVLILFQRSGEFSPLLAAGIPMYRVARGLIAAAIGVSTLLLVNQEFVVPRVAFQAYDSRGGAAVANQIEAAYDHSSHLSIDGQRLNLELKEIEEARFVIPAPGLAQEMMILEAPKARFRAENGRRPAGWILQDVTPKADAWKLTEQGRKLIVPLDNGRSAFVATAISCDQLYRRGSSFSLLSTPELLDRIHSPAFGVLSVNRLTAHVHSRLMQPLLNMAAVLMAIPLMVRRESTGLVVDATLCGLSLGTLFGIHQLCQYLGTNQVLPSDLAAWLPVIAGGGGAAWLSGWIRT